MQSALGVINNWLPTIGWSSVIGFVIFLLKLGWKASGLLRTVEQEWATLREDLAAVKNATTQATTNHLAHIQQATEETTKALVAHTKAFETSQQEINKTLEKQSEILSDLQLALVGLNEFLRGQAAARK